MISARLSICYEVFFHEKDVAIVKFESLEGFTLPFGGKLNSKNRWIKWSVVISIIAWDGLAAVYYSTMDLNKGRPCKDTRLVIGVLIVSYLYRIPRDDVRLKGISF